ncbi:MAG TPA: NADH-quinone oxidoreductase subunit L [Thermoleophilia bacterium]|nr:NADH-quinone oxidoreductase subunit L [Thermoleophilia bacterium]
MLHLLWLIPALPLAGFVLLTLLNRRLSRTAAAVIGAGSVGLAAIVAILVSASFMLSPPAGHHFHQVLWTWFDTGGLRPQVAFYLDAMTVVFILVITFVGFLIHLYSTEFMEHDEGFTRFFMYMNLFVASMLVLVLADNLLLLYLGWEGVGMCSYFLIAFWQKDTQNVYCGRKAFIITRIGDTAMIVGLFLLFTHYHTLEIQALMQAIAATPAGAAVVVAAAWLLLGGAVGKSAQLPLQTWLPDAMAGPTPVSALIHAATMVTAGVYLIARTFSLYTAAPDVRLAVAIIGTVTLLYAGFSALTQKDIKRSLAYSTVSQIGYMFLALGVAGWDAGIFHFMTHAFFKALLFLGAGVIIEALADEHDIFKMGGLRRELPVVFWTFTIGAASLAALPLVTAGYYSKDLIISTSLGSVDGSAWLWAGAVAGALLTGIYSFRLVFVVFFGEQHTPVTRRPRWRMQTPLVVLAVLSVIGGFVWLPDWMGGWKPVEHFLSTALPATDAGGWAFGLGEATIVEIVSLSGIGIAYLLWIRRRDATAVFAARPAPDALERYWRAGWGFDVLYEYVFVVPVKWFAHLARNDLVEPVVKGIAGVNVLAWRGLSASQNGLLRLYIAVAGAGLAVIIAVVVLR